MTAIDPMVDYRHIPAPEFGERAELDALGFAVCSHGGHIPNFTPRTMQEACDFHRRTAFAYLKVIDAALAQGADPGRWWRVMYEVEGETRLWCETSVRAEALEALASAPGGGRLQRLYVREAQTSWRDEL